jgi:hypothetical protein
MSREWIKPHIISLSATSYTFHSVIHFQKLLHTQGENLIKLGVDAHVYVHHVVSQATPSRKEGLVLCNSAVCSGSHNNWGVLIDHSALCANDIHSTMGYALRLIQNKPFPLQNTRPSERVWLARLCIMLQGECP